MEDAERSGSGDAPIMAMARASRSISVALESGPMRAPKGDALTEPGWRGADARGADTSLNRGARI